MLLVWQKNLHISPKEAGEYIDNYLQECSGVKNFMHEIVEKAHQDYLPTAFLSTVIDDCLEKGLDVTKGGAKYNLSGIQMIQVANLADSLAAIKQLVYDDKMISQHDLLNALQEDFKGYEIMQTMLLNKVPKYGNDVKWGR